MFPWKGRVVVERSLEWNNKRLGRELGAYFISVSRFRLAFSIQQKRSNYLCVHNKE